MYTMSLFYDIQLQCVQSCTLGSNELLFNIYIQVNA